MAMENSDYFPKVSDSVKWGSPRLAKLAAQPAFTDQQIEEGMANIDVAIPREIGERVEPAQAQQIGNIAVVATL